MRINVYAEELTDEVELVTKTVDDDDGVRVFYGIRFYLKSAPELHHSENDDDRSAITIWTKWTQAEGTDTTTLKNMLIMALGREAEIVGTEMLAGRPVVMP